MVVQPPVSATVQCLGCQRQVTMTVTDGAHGVPTHAPRDCPHCGGFLPLPSSTLFDQYRRQQHPFKQY